MPSRPLPRCSTIGCHDLATADGHGKCAAHKKTWVKAAGTRTGSTSQWRRVRWAHLSEHPWCKACGHIAAEVDHVIPLARGGAMWDPGNFQSLCSACHRAKSQSESTWRS